MDKQDSERSQASVVESTTEIELLNENRKFYKLAYATTPFSTPVLHNIEVGISVGRALQDLHPEHLTSLSVSCDGSLVTDFNYTPKENATVAATLTPGVDPVSGTALILWQIAIATVTIGVAIIGYNLYKPEDPDSDEQNRLASIRGAGNSARKYQPFRAILGKRMIAPDYIAEPYTEIRGDDEWLKLLLCVGYGPLKLEDFKIGNTPLSEYEHNIAYLDHYETFDQIRRLWNQDVVEEQLGIELNGPDSPVDYTNTLTSTSQTSSINPDQIGVEFLLPAGITGDEEHNALGVDHSYTNPISFTANARTISVGTKIKIGKVLRRGVTSSTKFRPMPGAIIQMSDNSYRICLLHRKIITNSDGVGKNHAPWGRTDGHDQANPSARNIYLRSWELPASAIVKDVVSGGGGYVYIDMDYLNGMTRYTQAYVETIPGNWDYLRVADGNFTDSSSISAYTAYGKSPRQVRGSVKYAPAHRYFNVESASIINTQTTKVSPINSEDNASIVDNIVYTKFRTFRDLSAADYEKLLGFDKPRLQYEDGGSTTVVRNFRPVIIALEVKATEQLSGMIDNFNCVATSCMPSDWNADWRNWPSLSLTPSENPADAYRWILQGPLQDAPMGNDRVNLDNLLEWKNYCAEAPPGNTYDTANQWRISYAMEEASTVMKELQKVAYTGRAEFSFDDSRYGVVVKKAQQYPVQVFSPKNSWGFQASRVYPDPADGIRIEFDNENKQYQQDEVDFVDPRMELTPSKLTGKFNATTIEGVPNDGMAARIGRMSFYETFLLRERYKFTTDVEGLVARRGSLVRMQNDIIDVGLGSGRIKEIGTDYFIIDETIELVYEEYFMDALDITFDDSILTFEGAENAEFGIQFRFSDGTIPESPYTFVYKGDGKFEAVDVADLTGLQVGDFALYGQLGREMQDCLVTAINYGEDLTCDISCVNYDPELFNIDENPSTNPLPDFVSNLNERVEFRAPNPPTLTVFNDSTGIDISKQQLFLSVEYNPQLEDVIESVYFQYRTSNTDDPEYLNELDPAYDNDPGWEESSTVPYGTTQYVLQGVERGTAYRFRARSRGRGNLYSAFSVPVNVIVPLKFPPDDVEQGSLTFEHTRQGVILKWGNVIDPDFQDYEVRTDVNVGDENGLVGYTTATRLNVGYNDENVTYYVYARTVYDAYSVNGASLNIPSYYVPTQLTARTQTDGISGTNIRWQEIPNSTFFRSDYVDYYEVRTNTLPGTDTGLVTTLRETSSNVGFVSTGAEPTYYVYARSVAGYYGVALEIIPDAPNVNPVESLIAVPIDNTAAIDWEAPSNVIYPIDNYRVEEKLPGRVVFTKVGNFAATYVNASEREGGTYTFRVRTVDVAGNFSSWQEVSVRVYDPTDFVLLYNQSVDFTQATVSNGVITTDEDGELRAYFPLSTTKTIQNYIDEAATESGQASPTFQNKNDSVGPYIPQYTYTGQSYFERVFDLFDGQPETDLFVVNNTIEIAYSWEYIQQNQNVDVTSTIEYSYDNSVWSTAIEGTRTYVTDQFRYIRVRIYFDSTANTTGLPFVQLNSLEINVDVKQKTDQGRAIVLGKTSAPYYTEIEFNKALDADTGNLINRFIDIDSVTATVRGDDTQGKYNVHTEFEYPNGTGGTTRDKFRAYVQDASTGQFSTSNVEISWIARGK